MSERNGKKFLTREEFFAFLEEDRKHWDESKHRWDENERRWDENEHRWEENQRTIETLARTIHKGLSKLGARLGIRLEGFSRELLRAFLARNGVKSNGIRRLVLKDEEGMVFGHPDDIELDIFMKEPLVVGEITSYLNEKDKLYDFHRKVLFVEKTYSKKARLKFIACLDIDPNERKELLRLARKLNIKVVQEE